MNFVEALKLKKCEIDAFLGCDCKILTSFKKELVDVERVQKIEEKEFKYLKDFNFQTKDPKNYII